MVKFSQPVLASSLAGTHDQILL